MSAVAMDSVNNAFAKNNLVRNSSDPNIINELQALRQSVQDSGCNVNVCFVLQGDNTITSTDFNNQISFVDLIASVITTDEDGGLCAVQYGRTTRPISPLTDDRDLFFARLDVTTKVGGNPGSFSKALNYARLQLGPHVEDANKIVLLSNFFDSRRPVRNSISQPNSLCNLPICLVSVGQLATRELSCPLPNLYPVDDFFHLLEIITGLVFDICGI